MSAALHVNGFTGKYAGSINIPDLAVTFLDLKGVDRLKLLVDVGFWSLTRTYLRTQSSG